jgi:hypothetical protein
MKLLEQKHKKVVWIRCLQQFLKGKKLYDIYLNILLEI